MIARVRLELQWVLAAYTASYACVVVALAASDLSRQPLLGLLLWPAVVAAFWIIARGASFSVLGSAIVAMTAVAVFWVLGQAELVLESRSMEAALSRMPLPVVAFGLGILVVLVVLWKRRDGAWKGLLWLALAEFGVTVFATYIITTRASDPGVWAYLRSPSYTVATSWETAARFTSAWLLTMFIALLLRKRLQTSGDVRRTEHRV